jgi:hypothetical protein
MVCVHQVLLQFRQNSSIWLYFKAQKWNDKKSVYISLVDQPISQHRLDISHLNSHYSSRSEKPTTLSILDYV